MLALLGIDVNLYEDNAGQPGALIPDNQVEVGETFFVEVTVEDLRDNSQGVNGLSLDLRWDAVGLEVIDDPFDPSDPTSPLVTSAFNGFRSGTLDEANDSAMIEGLRGVGPSQIGIGVGAPARFSLLHFRADDVSSSPLEFGIGDIGAGLVNHLRNLRSSDFVINEPVIHIVDGSLEEEPGDEERTLPSLAIGDATVTEGDEGVTFASLEVSLSAAHDESVQVQLDVVNGTASSDDDDFELTSSQVLTFAPGGLLTQTVSFQINGDVRFEADEFFEVHLSQPVNATLGDAIGEVTVVNDDQEIPRVGYTLQLTDQDGSPLEQDSQGRDIVEAGMEVTASVFVRDLQSDPNGGVFSAFVDLLVDSEGWAWNVETLEVAAGFGNGSRGVVSAGLDQVLAAGGAAGTTPSGGGVDQLLFTVQGVADDVAPGTEFEIVLRPADGPGLETLVFGVDSPVLATFDSQAVILAAPVVDVPDESDPTETTPGDGEEVPVEPEPVSPWQNPNDPLDVNGDGLRAPRDVLLIVNELTSDGPRLLPVEGPRDSEFFLDVNGDGGVSRLDALLIFNYLTFGTLPSNQMAERTASVEAGSAAEPTSPVASLSISDALPVLDASIDAWILRGLSANDVQRLADVELRIEDLEGDALSSNDGDVIILDVDAAGQGWFVDATPTANEEFVDRDGRLEALDTSLAAERFDLLSVITHELGQVLGMEGGYGDALQGEIGDAWLSSGERRLPRP